MRRLCVLFAVVCSTACLPAAEPGAAPTTTSTSTTTTTEPITPTRATEDFAACMGAEGIDVPAIPTGPDGLPDLQAIAEQVDTSRVDVRAALGACASILVAAGVIDLQSDPEVRALVQDLLGRYAECMRAEGIAEFPDPTPGFTGAGPPYPLESVPFDHSDFVDAASTCQRLLGAVEGMP